MRIKGFIALLAAGLLLAQGCNGWKDDFGALSEKFSQLQAELAQSKAEQATQAAKITAMEARLDGYKKGLDQLSQIVSAIQAGDYITSFSETEGGYTLNFSKHEPITIRDGKPGADGKTPAISVRLDPSDGQWYWTLDGDWLLSGGERVRASGRDGAPGASPKVGLKADGNGVLCWAVDGELLLSADGKPVPATGAQGDPGHSPVVTVVKGEGGALFWAVDGELLLSADGKPVPATGEQGEPGKDAPAPTFRINEGQWEFSLDGGSTWTATGQQAQGEAGPQGDSFFQSVALSEDGSELILTLADGSEIRVPVRKEAQAQLFDLTEEEKSGVAVNEIDFENNTISMSVPPDKIPEVGDILVSGITEDAPYGYLVQVQSVKMPDPVQTRADSKVNVTTAVAGCAIYDAFELLGIEVKGWYDIYNSESSSTVKDENGKEVPVVNKGKGYQFDIEKSFSTVMSSGVKIDVNFKKSLGLDKASFYLDATTPNILAGFDMAISNYDFLHAKASAGISLKGDFYEKYGLTAPAWITPYTFVVAGVPIVVTLMFKPGVPYELSLGGRAEMDIIKRSSVYHIGGYYQTWTNSFSPLPGTPGFIYEEPLPVDTDEEPGGREIRLTLDGKARIALDGEFSAGLYGGNVVGRDKWGFTDDGKKKLQYLTVGFNLGAEAEASFSLGYKGNIDSESSHPVRFIDDINFSANFYGKIWGTLLKGELLGQEFDILSGEKKWEVLKTSYQGNLFCPDYPGLRIKGINNQDYLILTAQRRVPVFGTPLYELNRGFCLEKRGTDEIQYFPSSESLDSRFNTSGWSGFMDPDTEDAEFHLPFKVSSLDRNAKYEIYPYCELTPWIGAPENLHYFVRRKGVTFFVDSYGYISLNGIDDVPGELL